MWSRLFVLFVVLGVGTAWAAPRVSVYALFKGRAVLKIDGKQRMLKVGETSPEGVKLLEANSRTAVLEIDGQRLSKQLGSDVSTGLSSPSRPSVKLMHDAVGMYHISGQINGRPAAFIVDTGASLVSMNANEADRLGIDYLGGRVATSSTAAGYSRIYLVNLDRVKAGTIELTNVQGAVHEGSFPEHTLLGMSFLKQVEMKNDNGVLTLTKKY
jgi:aspartyl protease family protein